MLIQRSQSQQFPSNTGMLPHPGTLFPTRPTDSIFRDPRLVDPRLIDPRIGKPEHLNLISPQAVKPERLNLINPQTIKPVSRKY